MMTDRGGETIRTAREKRLTRRRRLRIRHVALVLLVGFVLCLIALRWHWRREFRGRIEAVRAAGDPVTLEELDAWYPWPESGPNAASLVLDAAACYSAPASKDLEGTLWSVVRGRAARRGEPLAADVRDLLMQHVGANAKALMLLHEAAGTEHSRYPADLTKGYAETLTYLGDVVNTAGFLVDVEAILHAEHADAAGATQSILSSLGVARSLSWEPYLLSQISRLSCQRLALSALERVVTRVQLSDVQLVALTEALTAGYDPDAWRRALVGERCRIIALHEQPDLLGDLLLPKVTPRFVARVHEALGLVARSGIVFLELMDRCMKVRHLPLSERLEAAERVDEARHAVPGIHFIVHEFMPGAVGTMKGELTVIAQLRTAQTALAVERYRLASGGLPDALADFTPDYLGEVPTDPFDGKPLRYERSDYGFIVYSVGTDGVDDGGKERPRSTDGKANETYDITFTVER